MNGRYFSKLAIGNLQKNRRFYLPYIFTEAGLLACFYILITLAMDKRLTSVRGGGYLAEIMMLGVVVMVILSTILLFYMNSFLMKQRKHEFGLYNILGMEKRHVCRILWKETRFSNGAAIVLGLLAGIIFYKLSTLLICKILHVKSVLGFYYIKPLTLVLAAGFFIVLNLLLYLINSITIRLMKPVEMMQSKKAGEKEPKINWFLFIPGIIALARGYYKSVTCSNPIIAIATFFVAVILVIIGTYCLYVAGSVFVLRCLKANKKYYYNKKHMISVSGLLYRMRQNAVGLASITVLACGVLVMISTTISLYAGIEDSLKHSFHHQILMSTNYKTNDGETHKINTEEIQTILEDVCDANGFTVKDARAEKYLEVAYTLKNQELQLTHPSVRDADTMAWIVYLTADEYEKITGEEIILSEDEIAICSFNMKNIYEPDTLKIGEKNYKIGQRLDFFPIASMYNMNIVSTYGIVLPSDMDMETIYEAEYSYYDVPSEYVERLAANIAEDISREDGLDLIEAFITSVDSYIRAKENAVGQVYISEDSVWEAEENMFGLNGTLFFLGLILGFVFLFATALIIYYKQISEGYEDRERFQIMAKIGLSDAEAKKSISGQILLVFFLPLLVAGIHLAFAFPLLVQILKILQLGNTVLFAKCTLLAYAGFGIIYTGIYEMTAKVYYSIIS